MARSKAVAPLRTARSSIPRRPSFVEVFGKLGPLIPFIAIASMLWTVWLIFFNIAPNTAANFLMSTGNFDNGDFWLILRPEPVLLVFTVLCLVAIVIMYGLAILRMAMCSHNSTPTVKDLPHSARVLLNLQLSSMFPKVALHTWKDLTSFNGLRRKQWNILLKAVDLTLQILTLCRILEYGFSPYLYFGYASLLAANALSCAIFILSPTHHSALTEVLIDTVFDMLFAVGAPIVLLEYAYHGFSFDRKQAKLANEVMPPGSFEHLARLVADPREVNNFLLCFDALRTNTWSGLAVQTIMNLSFSYRLLRVIQDYKLRARRQFSNPSRKNFHTITRGMTKVLSSSRAVARPFVTQARAPRVLAFAFVAVGVIVIVFTHGAITHSIAKCKEYPQCAAFAYRWGTQSCPCLAFIDVVKAPRTWEEWSNPKDVTAVVAKLAATGDLLVLNIINRWLPVWPDELRRCENMQYISLMYTGVEKVPSWASSFTRLEYLSIEESMSGRGLIRMPDDLFDSMRVLTNIHLGGHLHIKSLPRLDGLYNLNSLSLAMLTALVELPDLTKLIQLQRVEFIGMTSLKQIPNFSTEVKLSKLAIVLSRPCCNGFLSKCDQSLSACMEMSSTFCVSNDLDKKILSKSTQQQLIIHSPSVCKPDELYRDLSIAEFIAYPTKVQTEKCQGVLYRECTFDNYSVGHSICINDRFQVVHCVHSDGGIALRRREISGGIGSPCDPEIEAWLGCPSLSQASANNTQSRASERESSG